MRIRRATLLAACALALMGCDFEGSNREPDVDAGPIARPVVPPPKPAKPVSEPPRFGVPHPSDLPRPINGGTLIVTRDGKTAIATDPDRDLVSIVDLAHQEVLATVPLEAGVEPGRLVEDRARRVHVVLRSTGEIATIDIDAGELIERRSVCPVPQGIAYRAADDSLLVACTSGELVTLPAKHGKATRSVRIEKDLRDVIVSGERTFVTRFKAAELLELDDDGKIIARTHAPDTASPFTGPLGNPVITDATPHPFTPSVAWRAVELGKGSVMMLHQRGRADVIDLSGHGQASKDADLDAGACFECGSETLGGPYGSGGFDCDSIVHSTLSRIGDDGVSAGPVLAATTLAVDAAASPDGMYIAVAVAGNAKAFPGTGALVLPAKSTFGKGAGNSCVVPGRDLQTSLATTGQVIAVAFTGDHTLVIQSRDPNELFVAKTFAPGSGPNWSADIALGGESLRDPGHDLFHTNAGAGIACASCHPGGGDDGRTWHFSDVGARRTQLFNMGIKDTLPLHWDGALATFDDLMKEVFVRRMGGAPPSPLLEEETASWIESLHPNNRIRASDDPAALRGKKLFQSADVGCSNCHNGEKLTNNMTVDVGTGGSFQVPSLIGVAYHEPYIHDGCAKTLRQRFDPACGGKQHGNTSQLDENQIDDLVAYLESL